MRKNPNLLDNVSSVFEPNDCFLRSFHSISIGQLFKKWNLDQNYLDAI